MIRIIMEVLQCILGSENMKKLVERGDEKVFTEEVILDLRLEIGRGVQQQSNG